MKALIKKIRLHVSSFGSQELAISELAGENLSNVSAETEDGLTHEIRATKNKNKVLIIFKNQKVNATINLFIYKLDAKEIETPRPPTPDAAPANPPKTDAPKRKFPFLKALQDRQEGRIALNREKIKAIREKDINYSELSGEKALTFDHTGCWARGLGMLQKAKQLAYQLKVPIHDYYDRITGQGDGAIIAAALAAGIDFERIGAWWITDWRKAHSPNALQGAARWAVSKIRLNESGHNAKKARKALRKLFLKTSVDMRMKDVLTKLQITVIQADLKISFHYSPDNPSLELYAAVEDSAVTKIDYNQRETIKGEAVFLGAIEKNDALGMIVSSDNKNLDITSIGAPVRVNPGKTKKLGRLGHAADKTALLAAGHFIYQKRIDQLMSKLAETGYKIKYLRLECGAIDHIVRNNIGDAAMEAGINSGYGQIQNIKEAI
jgi:hypothetical protein